MSLSKLNLKYFGASALFAAFAALLLLTLFYTLLFDDYFSLSKWSEFAAPLFAKLGFSLLLFNILIASIVDRWASGSRRFLSVYILAWVIACSLLLIPAHIRNMGNSQRTLCSPNVGDAKMVAGAISEQIVLYLSKGILAAITLLFYLPAFRLFLTRFNAFPSYGTKISEEFS